MPRIAAISPVEPVRDEPPVVESTAPYPRLVPVLVLIAALWWAQALLIPIVLSLVISYALEPLVARLQDWHMPRGAAVPIVLVAVLAGIGLGVNALKGEFVALANRLPEGAHVIAEVVRSQKDGHAGMIAKMQLAAKEIDTAAQASRQAKPVDGVQPVRIEEQPFKWNDWIWQGSHSVMELVVQLFAVVCLVYYLMVAGDMYRRKLVRIVGSSISTKKLTVQILSEIDRQIERFLMARALISLAVAGGVWLMFFMLGLDQAGVWAVLAGVLFTVPFVGPTIVIVGAALAALLQTGSLGTAASAAAACLVIAAIEGNVLMPWLMGRVGEMNAIAVFVSLLFWGWLWGAWGLLLAVPITAAAKAVCERVDSLNAYDELLKA